MTYASVTEKTGNYVHRSQTAETVEKALEYAEFWKIRKRPNSVIEVYVKERALNAGA